MFQLRHVGLALVSVAAALVTLGSPSGPASALCPIDDPTCSPGPTIHTYTSSFTVNPGPMVSVAIAGAADTVACPSTCTRSDSQETVLASRPTTGWPSYTLTITGGKVGYSPSWTGCTSVSNGVCTVVNDQVNKTVSLGWVDTTAPTVHLTVPAKVGTGGLAVALANDNSGAIASYYWSVDGAAYPATSGNTFALGSLAEGTHVVAVRAQDGSGNQSTAATATVAVDKHVGVTVSSVPAYVTGPPTLTISTDPDATTTCATDGGSATACAASWSPGPLTEGAHTLSVRATDDVANTATATRTFVVDATSPALSFTDGPAEGALIAASTTSITVHEAEANPGTLVCTLDTQPVACSPDAAIAVGALGSGGHTFAATAVDLAGNTSTLTRHFTVQAPGPGPSTIRSTPHATLTAPARPSSGKRAVLRLIVSPTAGATGVPTGTVVWKVDGRTVCRTTLTAGRATCRTGRLRAGRHTVVATYAGSAAYQPMTVRRVLKVRR